VDRLAIAAALSEARGLPDLRALCLNIHAVRDLAILVAGLALLQRDIRIDVRVIGKIATFSLMFSVPAISWANFHLGLDGALLALGWCAYVVGIVEYYVATAMYVQDMRAALRAKAGTPSGEGQNGRPLE